MASKSETGHAINVANFQALYIRLNSLGDVYNPSRTALQLPEMQNLLTEAQNAMLALNVASAAYAEAVHHRQLAYQPITELAKPVISFLTASVSNPAEAKTAAALVKKILADIPTADSAEASIPVKRASTLQKSYSMITVRMVRLIDILSANPAYAPVEADLSVVNLAVLVSSMHAKNNAVVQAQTHLDSARARRNAVLYTPGTGLVDVAQAAKVYCRAILNGANAQFGPIQSLPFKKLSAR